jgi:oxalate decarboxylase/phosphoglucose isomerase-like protein (cupin superfamily)
MGDRKLFVDENQIPSIRVQREGSSAYGFIRTLFDPETAGTSNGVLGSMSVPPGQPEPMPPHAHFEYDESEYIVKGEGYLLLGPSREQLTRYDLKPGCAFFVPAGYPHCVANTGTEEMKIVFAFYPAGIAGRTYREIATDLTDVKRMD